MSTPMKAMIMLNRLLVLALLVLGVCFWMGRLRELTMVHMTLGFVMVLNAVIFAVLAKAKGAPKSLTYVTIMWGIVTVAVGAEQMRVLVGSSHWIIQVVHLLLGMGMAWQVERLAKTFKDRPVVAATA